MAFFHLGKGHGSTKGVSGPGNREDLETSWPWAAEEGQQLMWILERETKLPLQNCVAGKQAEADSMQGKWAGAELHIKTESIATVGRLVDVLPDPHSLCCP